MVRPRSVASPQTVCNFKQNWSDQMIFPHSRDKAVLIPVPPNRRFQNFSPSRLSTLSPRGPGPFKAAVHRPISQGIDTDASNPASRLMLTILAGVAEFERGIIRERTISGVRKARADGKALGRPVRLFDRDKARELRASGSSWRRIAAPLGVLVSTVVDACTEIVPS